MNRQQRNAHRIVWFEIPVQSMDRAVDFYEHLTGRPLRRESIGTTNMAVFDYTEGGVSGALLQSPGIHSTTGGVMVYLNVDESGLDAALARTEAKGGRVAALPVQLPGDMGRFAHIRDSEGNLVGLHEV
ncbi:VOC family protein [Niveibacterium sp. SC-1]|uniref:VOC family protein n=1 Tax=Niveibacterium sp. SC-1 TaxID=3135646 RepID=UPI00311D959A